MGNPTLQLGQFISPTNPSRQNSALQCEIPGKLYISSGINQDNNYIINHLDFLLGTKYQLDIQQVPYGNDEALYQIFVNGNRISHVVNHNPMEYNNVKVYLSDPWHEPFPGIITKFQWDSGMFKNKSVTL